MLAEHVLKTGATARGCLRAASSPDATAADHLAANLGIGAFVAVPISGPEGDVMGVIQVAQSGDSAKGFADKDIRELELYVVSTHPCPELLVMNAAIECT